MLQEYIVTAFHSVEDTSDSRVTSMIGMDNSCGPRNNIFRIDWHSYFEAVVSTQSTENREKPAHCFVSVLKKYEKAFGIDMKVDTPFFRNTVDMEKEIVAETISKDQH
eukprot:TRINITY_DN10243_c0_g2_i7.p1 TRINITY_DN10243_c0_g2~~TRINITY_DN10243_c0_g2_i7.p1  ORF type:complete len:108 (-),score=23.47 TRINITY_DN10243_c0_g2_i7:413-736(-)